MVTEKIFDSGNLLAGFSVEKGLKGFRTIKLLIKLKDYLHRERTDG